MNWANSGKQNPCSNDYTEDDRLISRFSKEVNFTSSCYSVKLPF